MSAATCTCAPRRRFTRTHHRGCGQYIAPNPWRTCPVCGIGVSVVAVEPALGQVRLACKPCGLDWLEDVRQVDDDELKEQS